MKVKRILACLATSGLIAQPIFAADINSNAGVSISAGGGIYRADSDRNLDSDALYNLGLGYRFNESWELELNYMASEHDIDGYDGTADVSNYRLDGIYYFSNGALQPYLSLGVGEHEYKYKSGGGKVSDTEINAGLGVKWFLTPGLFLRADARLFDAKGGVLDSAGILSVGYLFGQSSARTEAAEPVAVVVADDDGDGVDNSVDECPDTPAGVEVDAVGCGVIDKPIVQSLQIDYDLNSSDIRPEYDTQIEGLVELMEAYPNSHIVVEGHTDDSGSESLNQDISQRRADEFKRNLVDRYGIDAARVTAIGKGELSPIVANDSAENRKKNRRVVVTIDDKS